MHYVGRVSVTNAVVRDPSELSTEWLTDVIGAGTVTEFTVERIGTGQMSECYRVALTYDAQSSGPASARTQSRCRRPEQPADRHGDGSV